MTGSQFGSSAVKTGKISQITRDESSTGWTASLPIKPGVPPERCQVSTPGLAQKYRLSSGRLTTIVFA